MSSTPPVTPPRRAPSILRRVSREPIAQFVAAALLIIGLEHLARRHAPVAAGDPKHIVIDDAFVATLQRGFERASGRAMTKLEARALVDQAIDEEILYREARALRLDDDDGIIRRRLIQKAEFLVDDVAPIPEPTDAELVSYFAGHGDAYRGAATVTFRQLFFSRDRRGFAAEADARDALGRLARDPHVAVAADPFLAGTFFVARSERDIDGLLGAGVGAPIAGLEPGAWAGPFASAFGFHVVRVEERHPSSVPPLAEVRAQVRQAVIDVRREENRRKGRAALRASYRIDDRTGTSSPPGAEASLERHR